VLQSIFTEQRITSPISNAAAFVGISIFLGTISEDSEDVVQMDGKGANLFKDRGKHERFPQATPE